MCYLLLFPCCFNILSLSLIFVISITICLGVFLSGFILYGTLCAFWTWVTVSFPRLCFQLLCLHNIFSGPFSLSFSETPITRILVHLTLSQRSLKPSSFLFILFSFFYPVAVISTILSASLLIHSSVSFSLLLFLLVYFSLQLLYSSSLIVLYIF